MADGYVFDGREHNNGAISIGAIANGHHQGAIVAVTPGSRTRDPVFAAVPADEVPAVARRLVEQMHEAAGLPVPIVLDRPECPAHFYELSGVKVSLTETGLIHIDDDGCDDLPPYKARALAERLAHLADEAERSPAAKLATVILSALPDTGMVHCAPGVLADAVARAIVERYDLTDRKSGTEG